ncbi:conserved Plasmodium protein, unknown function [Plasmodium knowlesi strain H]|uniref:Uncharacterized protein n=3 Tax=Plasmodium knowlesi TaxID=5850 RepID=A0A1A7VKG8_PLAKH|nr:conserved protein, unknown function [Plasmodium knowlesi strain H]OTN67681.1 Uncharacterized protein PKNOH_S05385200 [Plasmodium knowlesi]CAA9990439.1 conserved protein, unknown function [Plasmodium knowlesi strain H]SBO19645.1 conserved Plasmodium protein, unknown function [Plasmodium knowlesi strain H]SBO22543.1 conserved Plasmodium protein, unknown function [Plasmodium knowlesi strain H]VVS79913.1 conserved protein, unknown function [Plasmodium knowlesi strain H]
MNVVKKILILHLLFVCQQILFARLSMARKEEMNPLNFMPSSSLLYPLDFQQNWQASEPIPLEIHYDVPAYGYKDLLMALEYQNDLEHYDKERGEVKRRIIEEQKRLEENLWRKIQLLKMKEKNLQNRNFLRARKDQI